MGWLTDLKNDAGGILGAAKDQIKPILPHNPAEALLALAPGGGLLLPSLHKSQDIGNKSREEERFQKNALRRQAIERAMTGGNRLGRTITPPKPLDLSNYAASDALQKIIANIVGKKLGA